MQVLQVVHALPPAREDDAARYAAWLAEGLAEPHDVAVATPRGGDTDVAGATVHELPRSTDWTDPSGVASGLERGVDDAAVDGAFVDLLETVEPDVVHFQHLQRTSATLPERCRERGVPSVYTLHDFWSVCHRVRLLRPDGRRCSGPESAEKCAACYADALERAQQRRSEAGAGARDETTAVDPPEPGPLDDWSSDGADATVDGVGRSSADGPGLPPVDLEDVGPAVVERTERLEAAREAVDLLVAPSAFLRDRFVDLGTDSERVLHSRPGVRTARYEDTGFSPDDGVAVGCVGPIAHERGLHVLVRAFGAVQGDASLHVFGAFDPEDDAYHAQLRDAAGDGVTFHGAPATDAEPFETIDVLVEPSLGVRSGPLTIQEAFAAGVPVVTGDEGGAAELVDHGTDGLTLPSGDPVALAERLQRLVDDPGHVRRLRSGVERPKSAETHAYQLSALYRVLRGGASAPLSEVDLSR